MYKDNANL